MAKIEKVLPSKEMVEAVDLSIEIWEELSKTGQDKGYLPKELYSKIEYMRCECPLCELIKPVTESCIGCPLESCTIGTSWDTWIDALEDNNIELVKSSAQEIVNTLKKWKEDNDG